MRNVFFGGISFTIGLIMLIFSRPLSRAQIKSQNEFWGFNFGEKEIAISRIVILIVGAGFVIVGLLAILNIMQFK